MKAYGDMANRDDPKPETVDEIARLVDAVVDGVVTDEQSHRLNELLGHSVVERRCYLRCIAMHSALKSTAGNQVGRRIEELRQRLERNRVSQPDLSPRLVLGGRSSASLLRAAVVLFVVSPLARYVASRSDLARDPAVGGVVQSPGSSRQRSVVAAQKVADHPPSLLDIVRVVRISPQTLWSHPNESFAMDSVVRAGSRLRILEGEVELLYESGVNLILIGPVDFVLHERGGTLRRGGLMASVPQAGHGFTIDTPNGKVVDLGTEFGVMVDDFGVSEVSVFKGIVEAFPSRPDVARDGKIQLSEGSALQWNKEMVKSLEADPRRLPVTLASYLRPTDSYEAESNEIPIVPGGIMADSDFWTSLGETSRSAEGVVFEGAPAQEEVPYLVSHDQFDPTAGPLTVICDIRFPQLAPDDVPSFSILTRCADDRSQMDRSWRDILSTCVRCNFRSANNETDGLLETSTKYERDRELTSISWGGFRRPQQGVVYRLVMRDDGVNVSFAVSHREQQLIAKTVTCRSLFQGYKNHIAIEGWKGGKVIVENVQIHQSKNEDLPARRSTRFDERVATRREAEQESRANELSKRIPSDAKLVVEDDFDAPQLNQNLWSVLGDVHVSEGAVSLGNERDPDHIDTFHPRPYLLSRKAFAPEEGTLFVLGRIEFDENYLNGYGGSFAVMSRCTDRYGEGPEWAVSALSQGIRCNLWPAATRADHNIEIHEKTGPNSLTFLRGSGLKVDRTSRCYFFLMEDSGGRANVTFQNIADPAISQTIACDTSDAAPRSGLIGFESCWGSRVMLDDIQVFQRSGNPASDNRTPQ